MGHTPNTGKNEPRTGESSSPEEDVLISTNSSRAAGVVLRATVETFGPAGDAELHLTVKWPAAVLAAQPAGPVGEKHSHGPGEVRDNNGYDTEGNIHTEKSTPPERSKDKLDA